ncbi:MAG TPA: tetratricopeptide repeat protein, partial [Flavobacteriales bacterium]|nr:tetratricopeptide repeat protein [Flavobacteriales bacterium]
PDRDYAQFQKGLCQGLLRKQNEEIATLKGLLADAPNSRYAADAKFQLGETYVFLENDVEALKYHQQVIDQHAGSPLVRKSMLQVALIKKRQGHTEEAIAQFKEVIANFHSVEGSREALAGLENIYVEQGRVAEYEAYVRTLNFVDASTLGLDEKYYESAEKLYQDGKCDQAIGAFGDYLIKYPTGAFALNAHSYRGDCHYRAGHYDQALPDLEEVVRSKDPRFLESALRGASDILYRDKRWEGALDYFAQLEQVSSFKENTLTAQVGQMRCLSALDRSRDAAKAAEKVAANADAPSSLKAEAGLLVAKDLLMRNELDAAYAKYKAVQTGNTGAEGAEAKYHMAYVRHLQKDYKKAETEVFDLLKKYASQGHWKARALILLGDVYVQLQDPFQAKAALQGVIDNCPEPDLVAQARQRLADINASEVQQNAPALEEELTIPLPGNTNGK